MSSPHSRHSKSRRQRAVALFAGKSLCFCDVQKPFAGASQHELSRPYGLHSCCRAGGHNAFLSGRPLRLSQWANDTFARAFQSATPQPHSRHSKSRRQRTVALFAGKSLRFRNGQMMLLRGLLSMSFIAHMTRIRIAAAGGRNALFAEKSLCFRNGQMILLRGHFKARLRSRTADIQKAAARGRLRFLRENRSAFAMSK